MAIKLLKSQGVYLTDQRSKDVSEFVNIKIDYLILMGCGDECPNLVAEKRIEWDIPDPKDMEEPEFRNVIENIEAKVKKLIKTIDNEYSL
jgi:protein-tyrosine-phosphatase